ncbi:MAG: M55 family metallopeptidase [Acidobacteriota bacterium]|nr:MAG: M55 family metallopeptidase [Acidobacteriota bacterium]
MKMRVVSILNVVLFSLAHQASSQIKVYISADMEGVVGAVTGAQLSPSGFEYQKFREYMTEEVLAAIRGARAAGATEFLVSDSHGNGQNILIDRLPKKVQIVRSWPRPLGMMGGLDESFDAAIFIGYHTSTSNTEGVRAHTMSSATLTDVRLNGASVAESGFNAAIAGHFGVPIVMVSGDDAIVAETKRYVGDDVEGAVVKWAKSFHSARTLTPEAGYEVIEAAARRAIEGVDELEPMRRLSDLRLEISFKNYRQAEILSYLSVVERIDSHSIRYIAKDMVDASMFMQFVNNYEPGLSP